MAIGYVYLMTNGREYKIGLTASEPDNRRKQLQTGNSSKIELVSYVLCKNMEALENKLHKEFTSTRQIGEWFSLNDDDLYTVFESFKIECINEDMSLIPDIRKDIDTFMQIDGRRLAYGKSLLHKNKYLHIENHKEIVMEYMQKTEILIKRGFEIIAEEEQKAEEEKFRLFDLIEEDAKRILAGETPLHTLDYSELNGWKMRLDETINQKVEHSKKVKEQKKREEDDLHKQRQIEIEKKKVDDYIKNGNAPEGR